MKNLYTDIFNFVSGKSRAFFRKHSLPRWMVFAFDGSAVFLTFLFSYVLRHNFELSDFTMSIALRQSLLVIAVYNGFEFLFKSFAGLIRHTTIRDIFNVLLSTTSALVVFMVVAFIGDNKDWEIVFIIPKSILLIHYVTLNAFLFISRISIKMFYEMVAVRPVNKRNVVIYGAGAMGVIVNRVIGSDTENDFNIIAFLDEDKKLQRKNLEGIPVFSPEKLTTSFLEKNKVKTMIFAINDIESNRKRDIYREAVDQGLEVLQIPVVSDWLNGSFEVKQLKKIKVQDLLSRDPIQLNMKRIADGLRDKTILVTGAAGSIGSELVRQLTRFNVGRLILVDNAETPMFHLEGELLEHFAHAPVRTILADVTDPSRMDQIFRENRPEFVFHAAAYKHVPLMEQNPYEAVRVNVGGTTIMTNLAVKYGVEKFVMVSTDKAVNPTNVMGASKRTCEQILRSRSNIEGNKTQFVITRFGNVLGSNGSVIPIFRKQIEEGGPVTVTHPEITRYFMTIPEACQLVLEAGFMGSGGEIFVFDMGEPVKIADLARQMIKLSGFEPDKDIKIEYTGLRPGEKLYEELLTNQEKTLPTYNKKVRIAEVAEFDHEATLAKIVSLLQSCERLTDKELVYKLKSIVPEYQSSNSKYLASEDDKNLDPDLLDSVKMEVYPD
ncbi:MAG: nucleoside-diphosphate sugar epimerase/dehydratase [Bacteroidales bacterium]|nr:nucleoside-diphosphate sugar epimerase/dehydratase [Bacteroidales bacterium]